MNVKIHITMLMITLILCFVSKTLTEYKPANLTPSEYTFVSSNMDAWDEWLF